MLLLLLSQRNALVSAIWLIVASALLYAGYLYQHSQTSRTAWTIDLDRSRANVADDFGNVNTTSRIEWFKGLNLTYPIQYSCRQIFTQINPALKRASLSKVDVALFEHLQTIGSAEGINEANLTDQEPIILDVPPFVRPPVNASNLMFGIQTTLKRLDSSIPQFLRWLSHTEAKLFVVVIESESIAADITEIASLQSRMRNLGLDVTILQAKEGDTFPQRYFSLVNILYQHRGWQTEWISLIDDDTFFPSMPAILSMLSKYNSKDPYYIGSLSEDWWAVSHYGYMGFGGAGLFLSVPLVAELDPHTLECKDGLRSSAGDITVMDCIYAHTSIKLTHVPDLHQADMHGDLSGFYESGRFHLSLHHWKEGSAYGKGYPVDLMHLVSDVCGQCFMQRWQFGDDTVLSNGFSIAIYPGGHLRSDHPQAVDMSKMEETWSKGMNVIHSLGPVRERLALDVDKIQYILLDARRYNGGVGQLYWHKGTSEDPDMVLELFWKEKTV